MSYKQQLSCSVVLACLALSAINGIFTEVNGTTVQNNSSKNEQLLAQNQPTEENDFFVATFPNCKRSSRTVICESVFKSKSDRREQFNCQLNNLTKLYDYSGNTYLCSTIKAGNVEGKSTASIRFPQGTPVKIILTFNEIPETTNEFATLEIHHHKDFLKFRNVKVYQ